MKRRHRNSTQRDGDWSGDWSDSHGDSEEEPIKRRKCGHGRCKRVCKDRGGSGICPHGRRKSRCEEFGGSEICPHGRAKSTCKQCGGSGICAHGREKKRCKECGGPGRQKIMPKEGESELPKQGDELPLRARGRQKGRYKEDNGK